MDKVKAEIKLSKLGLGTVPIAGFGRECSYEQFESVVTTAFHAGYHYFDAAPMYGLGKAESYLGHTLRTHGLRDKVILSTKVGRLLKPVPRHLKKEISQDGPIAWKEAFPFEPTFDYSYDGIMRSIEDSCQRFGLDYFDIIHVHDIGLATHNKTQNDFYWKQLQSGGFKALDEIRTSGLAGAIGIGVNETEVVIDMTAEFDLDFCLVAGCFSLLNHKALDDFFPIMKSRDIKVIAAGVFNSGILGGGVKGSTKTFNYAEAPEEILQRVEKIEHICANHDVALPEAAIQFVSSNESVSCILQGCKNVDEVIQNAIASKRKAPFQLWEELSSEGLIPSSALEYMK